MGNRMERTNFSHFVARFVLPLPLDAEERIADQLALDLRALALHQVLLRLTVLFRCVGRALHFEHLHLGDAVAAARAHVDAGARADGRVDGQILLPLYDLQNILFEKVHLTTSSSIYT